MYRRRLGGYDFQRYNESLRSVVAPPQRGAADIAFDDQPKVSYAADHWPLAKPDPPVMVMYRGSYFETAASAMMGGEFTASGKDVSSG